MTADKIKELVAQMTLEEKASMCSGGDFWHTEAVERLGIPASMVSDGPHGLRKQNEQGDHLGVNDSIKAVCFPAGCGTEPAGIMKTASFGMRGNSGEMCPTGRAGSTPRTELWSMRAPLLSMKIPL